MPPYRCQFCGALSWLHPLDQEAPADYCGEMHHGEPPEQDPISLAMPRAEPSLLRQKVDEAAAHFARHLDDLLAGIVAPGAAQNLTRQATNDGTERFYVNDKLVLTVGPVTLVDSGGTWNFTRSVTRHA